MTDPAQTPLRKLDTEDRKLLHEMQRDAARPLERIAQKVGLSKTAVWNRLQRLVQEGTIRRQTVEIDPARIGLQETFFVAIRTAQHDGTWLAEFQQAVQDMPEITEAHRLAGSLDYLLKVQVPSTAAFDAFYKRLVQRISLHDVSSSLSMEVVKPYRGLPVDTSEGI